MLITSVSARGTSRRIPEPPATALRSPAMTRVFSGIQPTGDVHLGNYLGALRQLGRPTSTTHDAFYCVVDLHALTVPQDPARAAGRRPSSWPRLLLAVGLDPDVCTLFVQSHVPEHSQLAWLMECTASLRRAAAG